MNYDSVKIKGPLELGLLFQGVAKGDLQAFQDVWMPNHKNVHQQAPAQDRPGALDPWYEGQTTYGLTVLTYMGVESIADLTMWARTRSSVSSRARPSCPRSRTRSSPNTTWT